VSKTTAWQDLVAGLWKQNPVFVTMLGTCPTMAITNSVANAFGMGAATFFVLLGSNILVAAARPVIPKEIRIACYIMIIATFVQIADFTLAAVAPTIHKQLGAFVALIVVNCIILGRAEAFASKNTVWRSTLDAIGAGIGFQIVLLLMATPREILGNGTLLGFPIMGPHFQPWVIMILPPGGFLMLGSYLLLFAWWKGRKQLSTHPRRWLHEVTAEAGEA
jgi:electron transport complex protein RnfE